jgi:hypothetical protein
MDNITISKDKHIKTKKLVFLILIIAVIIIGIALIFVFNADKSNLTEEDAGLAIAKWADVVFSKDCRHMKIHNVVVYQPLNDDGTIKNTHIAISYDIPQIVEDYYSLILVENDGDIIESSYKVDNFSLDYGEVYIVRESNNEEGYYKLNSKKVQKIYDEYVYDRYYGVSD